MTEPSEIAAGLPHLPGVYRMIGKEGEGWTYAKYLLQFERGNAYAPGLSAQLKKVRTIANLERVGDHAKNIAEHVIYLVKGTDVRHLGLSGLEEQVKSE